jgi:glycosyltransferase involved in cell wall biosynthesis
MTTTMQARRADPAVASRTQRGTQPSSRRVLLTVSGVIPRDLHDRMARDECPRPDYVALAESMDADLLDVDVVLRRAGIVGRVLLWLSGPGPLLAWACFRRRRRYDVVVTDGEHVGLPFALLSRLTRHRSHAHVMIGHILSVPKKAILIKALRLQHTIDRILVYSSWQQRFIVSELGFAASDVVLTPFMVDTRFFDPVRVEAQRTRMICAAGLERRDYPTLLEAVRDLDVRVVIAADSPWSKGADTTRGRELSPNVEVCSLGFRDLRQLYADALFVVMPLKDVEFQAGVTTVLEAMAMSRAVVCSSTRGQTDVIEHGVTGLYVPPGDAAAMRATIERLLHDVELADWLGAAGREHVERVSDVRVYARRLAGVIEATRNRRRGGSRGTTW